MDTVDEKMRYSKREVKTVREQQIEIWKWLYLEYIYSKIKIHSMGLIRDWTLLNDKWNWNRTTEIIQIVAKKKTLKKWAERQWPEILPSGLICLIAIPEREKRENEIKINK